MYLQQDISPSADEAAMASLAYSQWERAQAESMAEYVHRRRTVDLSLLADEVIRDKLTDKEREAVTLHFFDRLSLSQIAERLSVNRATVSRTLERAQEKIRQYLQYVVQYQYNLKNVTFLPLAVREAMVTAAARHRTVGSFAERLVRARECENICPEQLAHCTQIPPARLARLESGEALPDADELLRIACFFGTTTDALLKGESHGTV
ncbi:MAG: sigma-70 family RNA polymerase sigma factor [Oscillospiraceae bacterium]|nr:sigma-70 family RNA polymerase sigma factor [Oscillospiraceae bacterium]